MRRTGRPACVIAPLPRNARLRDGAGGGQQDPILAAALPLWTRSDRGVSQAVPSGDDRRVLGASDSREARAAAAPGQSEASSPCQAVETLRESAARPSAANGCEVSGDAGSSGRSGRAGRSPSSATTALVGARTENLEVRSQKVPNLRRGRGGQLGLTICHRENAFGPRPLSVVVAATRPACLRHRNYGRACVWRHFRRRHPSLRPTNQRLNHHPSGTNGRRQTPTLSKRTLRNAAGVYMARTLLIARGP